jgi:hypothetical protein
MAVLLLAWVAAAAAQEGPPPVAPRPGTGNAADHQAIVDAYGAFHDACILGNEQEAMRRIRGAGVEAAAEPELAREYVRYFIADQSLSVAAGEWFDNQLERRYRRNIRNTLNRATTMEQDDKVAIFVGASEEGPGEPGLWAIMIRNSAMPATSTTRATAQTRPAPTGSEPVTWLMTVSPDFLVYELSLKEGFPPEHLPTLLRRFAQIRHEHLRLLEMGRFDTRDAMWEAVYEQEYAAEDELATKAATRPAAD